MAYESKPGDGALFKNDRKEKETHPDYKGSLICPVCNAALWLSSWIKKAANKPTFMSISAQPKDKDAKPPAATYQQPSGDSDVPF